MQSNPPLYLYLALAPERSVRPVEAADVLQSVDDMYRLADRYWELFGRQADPAQGPDPDQLVDFAFAGGGPDSPLVADQFRFGSPLEVVTQIPWEVYVVSGAPTLWLFIERIEKIWNMPRRIRVESARLRAEKEQYDLEYWRAKLAKEDAETMYWIRRRAGLGRFDQGGPAEPGAFLGKEGAITDERPTLRPPENEGADKSPGSEGAR